MENMVLPRSVTSRSMLFNFEGSLQEGDTTDTNLPLSRTFRCFSPNLILQGDSLTSLKLSKNPSKSSSTEVEDFKKDEFLVNQGNNGANALCIGEYFNEE